MWLPLTFLQFGFLYIFILLITYLTCLQTCISTCPLTIYPHASHAQGPTNLQTYIPIYLQTYRPTILQTYNPTVQQTYRPTDLQSYSPTDLQTYRPTILQSNRSTCKFYMLTHLYPLYPQTIACNLSIAVAVTLQFLTRYFACCCFYGRLGGTFDRLLPILISLFNINQFCFSVFLHISDNLIERPPGVGSITRYDGNPEG